MKNFKKAIFSLFIIFIFQFYGECSELSTFVESSLRKPLNLITGPATQVVDFDCDGKTFVVVIADLSFNKNLSPFGNTKAKNERTSEKEIEKAVKNTFLKIQNTKFKMRKEIIIVVIDKKLFGRTNNKTLREFMFSGKFQRGKLIKVTKLH